MAASQVTAEFSCPVETLWHTVTDLEHTAWRSDIERVAVLDAARFVEHTHSGYATRFTVTACEALRLWAFTMENGNMSGAWEGHLPGGGGRNPASLHRNRQRQALVDAPLCPRLSEAAAGAVSERPAPRTFRQMKKRPRHLPGALTYFAQRSTASRRNCAQPGTARS